MLLAQRSEVVMFFTFIGEEKMNNQDESAVKLELKKLPIKTLNVAVNGQVIVHAATEDSSGSIHEFKVLGCVSGNNSTPVEFDIPDGNYRVFGTEVLTQVTDSGIDLSYRNCAIQQINVLGASTPIVHLDFITLL
jgi:hypothetical protein